MGVQYFFAEKCYLRCMRSTYSSVLLLACIVPLTHLGFVLDTKFRCCCFVAKMLYCTVRSSCRPFLQYKLTCTH